MRRVDLLSKVETAARGLAGNDIIPIMTHLHMTGEHLVGYNGSVGVIVPLTSPIRCCVPGAFFASMLKAAGAKEVELELEDGTLLVRGAATKFKSPTMPSSAFPFELPEEPSKRLKVDGKELQKAMKICLPSVGLSADRPDQLGITFLADKSDSGEGMFLYATTGKVMTRAFVANLPFTKRMVLPGPFCRHFVELYAGEPLRYYVDENGLILGWGEGGNVITMCCAFIQPDKPLPYNVVFASHVKASSRFIPVAPRLEKILGRACIVAKGDVTAVRTKITIKEDRARFFTRSKAGEVSDFMSVVEGHPEVVIEVDPVAFRDGCESFKEMEITSECINMRNDFAHYIISSRQ